jgi:hypothetical protein
MPRNTQDALLTITRALPGSGATVTSTSIDLGQITADSVNELVDLLLSVPAVPSLANAETLTCTIQDSADNSTFAAINTLGTLVLTGAGGVGVAATSRRYKLPPATRRYVRVSIVGSASSGANTGVSATLQLLT